MTVELKPLKEIKKSFKSTDFLAIIILAAGLYLFWQGRKEVSESVEVK